MEPVEKQWHNKTMIGIASSSNNSARQCLHLSPIPKRMMTASYDNQTVCSSSPIGKRSAKHLNVGSSGNSVTSATASHRLYLAPPQPAIRRYQTFTPNSTNRRIVHGVEIVEKDASARMIVPPISSSVSSAVRKPEKSVSNARRRRRDAATSNHGRTSSSLRNKSTSKSGSGNGYGLERQSSDRSLSLDGLVDNSHSMADDGYNSSDAEDHAASNNSKMALKQRESHAVMNASAHRSMNDLSISSSRRSRKGTSKSTTKMGSKTSTTPGSTSAKSSLLQHRSGFRNNSCHGNHYHRNSSRILNASNLNDSFSDHYKSNNKSYHQEDDSYGNGFDNAMNFQSDIMFVESGGNCGNNNTNNAKQPLYKSWLKTMRSVKRQNSDPKTHPTPNIYRFIPLKLSSFLKNLGINATSSSSCRYVSKKTSYNYNINWWQILFIVICGIVILDSRTTIHKHRIQIQKYDEERAHILEQMTWIDRAAKRVHNNYYQKNNNLPNNQDASDAILLGIPRETIEMPSINIYKNESALAIAQKELDFYRIELDKIQVKIQSNARDRNQQQFGDKPIQLSLPLLPDANEATHGEVKEKHLIIELWDDTPHAASTILQQVNKHYWDEIDFQRVQTSIDPIPGQLSHHDHRLDCIQITPKSKSSISISPTIEFIEKSRGCNHPGSVALRQLESDDFHLTVLKVYITEESQKTPHDANDICIGTVISGLETLISRLPKIPIIHKEDDDADSKEENKLHSNNKSNDNNGAKSGNFTSEEQQRMPTSFPSGLIDRAQ